MTSSRKRFGFICPLINRHASCPPGGLETAPSIAHQPSTAPFTSQIQSFNASPPFVEDIQSQVWVPAKTAHIQEGSVAHPPQTCMLSHAKSVAASPCYTLPSPCSCPLPSNRQVLSLSEKYPFQNSSSPLLNYDSNITNSSRLGGNPAQPQARLRRSPRRRTAKRWSASLVAAPPS